MKEKMIVIQKGIKWLSPIRSLLFVAYFCTAAIWMFLDVDLTKALFLLLIAITILRYFEYKRWEIDPDIRAIRFINSRSTREIKPDNISQVITRSKSLRVFYDDGSDLKLPTDGLPQESLQLIKQILNIESAVGADLT